MRVSRDRVVLQSMIAICMFLVWDEVGWRKEYLDLMAHRDECCSYRRSSHCQMEGVWR